MSQQATQLNTVLNKTYDSTAASPNRHRFALSTPSSQHRGVDSVAELRCPEYAGSRRGKKGSAQPLPWSRLAHLTVGLIGSTGPRTRIRTHMFVALGHDQIRASLIVCYNNPHASAPPPPAERDQTSKYGAPPQQIQICFREYHSTDRQFAMASPNPGQNQSRGRQTNYEDIDENERASPLQPTVQNQIQYQNQDPAATPQPTTQPRLASIPPPPSSQPRAFHSTVCESLIPQLSPPDCSICMEPYTTLALLHPCHHFFDYACIEPWILTPLSPFRNPGCPMCRSAIDIIERTDPAWTIAVGRTMRCERYGGLEQGRAETMLAATFLDLTEGYWEASRLSSGARRREADVGEEMRRYRNRDMMRRYRTLNWNRSYDHRRDYPGEESDRDSGIDISDNTNGNPLPITSEPQDTFHTPLNIPPSARNHTAISQILASLDLSAIRSLYDSPLSRETTAAGQLQREEVLLSAIASVIASTPPASTLPVLPGSS